MARKKSFSPKKNIFRLFKPRGLIVLAFLIVSLVVTVALVTNPNISLDIRNWAASNTCSGFAEPTCRISSGCTWIPEKIVNSTIKGTCEGVSQCIEYQTKQSCGTYNGCVWEFQKTTVPAFCSGTPSTNKTCGNAENLQPAKHGDVSWIGEINYVCNGAVGDWIDCNNSAKLADSPFGADFKCQSGGNKTMECLPPKCMEDTNKLQTCTKVGVRLQYDIIDCSTNGQVCSNAKCVDKVNCDGYPRCPQDPAWITKCTIDKTNNTVSYPPEKCLANTTCKGENGFAKCSLATEPPPPPPPPDCSTKPDLCTNIGKLSHCDPQTGNYVTNNCPTGFVCPPGGNGCINIAPSPHPNCAFLLNYCANDGTLNYCDPTTGQYANKPCRTGEVCPDGGNACIGAFDCSTKPDKCNDVGQRLHCDTRTGYYATEDCPDGFTCPAGGNACAPEPTIGPIGPRCYLWIPWSSKACENCPSGEYIDDLDGNPWNGRQHYCLKPSECQTNERQCTSSNILQNCVQGIWNNYLDCNLSQSTCTKVNSSYSCKK